MNGRSSTSSSDAAVVRRSREWPLGLLGAVAIIAGVHLAVRLAWPVPFANEFLRQRAAAAVKTDKPRVLIAGDSRTQLGIDERRLSTRLGLPEGQVVNVSVPSGDSSMFLAAYREFGEGFAPRPIVLLGVSFFGVSDGSSETIMDDLLWSLPMEERLKLVKPAKAISDVFLPEKFLWLRLTSPVRQRFPTRIVKYNPPIPATMNVRSSPSVRNPRGVERVKQIWFTEPNIDGVRWAKFTRDVRVLGEAGIQLVIVDLPCHPMFMGEIANTPAASIERRFHEKLAGLCVELGVPLLRYDLAALGDADLDAVFMDLTHFNESGAAMITDRVAMDLGRLIAAGQVQLPESADPAGKGIKTVARADAVP
jgi:hypothetical protein